MAPQQQQPRAVRTMTQVSCPADDVAVPAKKEEAPGTGKRRWTDKLKRKIVEVVRPSRRGVATNKVEPRCDVDVETKRLQQALIAQHQDRPRPAVTEVWKQHYYCDVDVEKQRLRQEVAEVQARRRRSQRSGAQALRKEDVTNPGVEPSKGIDKAIKPAVAAATQEGESVRALVELLFPIGVLDKPPKSCTSSGPRRRPSPAFQTTSVTAAAAAHAGKKSQGDGSSTPVDRDVVDQRSEAEESTDHQATRRRRRRSLRWSEQVSQNDTEPNDDDGAPAAASVNLDARPKKGILKVRPTVVAATPTLVELLFPVGFMSKPPQSFRSSGPENSLRRSRYLTEYCPFERDGEESAPVQEETLPPEPDRVEDVPPVKTGLPFDSPAAEAEFVGAIFSRHLLKDDFINRYAFKRSCERFATEQSLQG